MRIKSFVVLILGAGLLACSSVSEVHVSAENKAVLAQAHAAGPLDSLIAPYRDSLTAEMNEVIGRSADDLVPERPSGTLNNWTADALLRYGRKYVPQDASCISLLNTGGLRSVISTGAVTLGDMYKVMPFDNLVVVVRISPEKVRELENYLVRSGGEPIGGTRLVDGKLQLPAGDRGLWVITSDYLANGGDKMNFLRDPEDIIQTDVLLRDVFIDAVKQQQVLRADTTSRIQIP